MGSADNDHPSVRKSEGRGKSKRGSVNNGRRLAGLNGKGGKAAGTADWSSVPPEAIGGIVGVATLRGMIISFKLSRDGGAYGLSLYDDGEKADLWFNQDADIVAELEQVYYYIESLE